MSATNWLRRSSGLVVPSLGFANLAGQMQPCPGGDCCGDPPVPCVTRCDGDVAPSTMEITVAGVVNSAEFCLSGNQCDTVLNGTFVLDSTTPCNWGGIIPGDVCSISGAFGGISLSINPGFIRATLSAGCISGGQSTEFRVAMSNPFDCFGLTDVALSYFSDSSFGVGCNYCVFLAPPTSSITMTLSSGP